MESFNISIELDPNDAALWFDKGNALDDLGRHEEALEAFDQSIELDPNNADIWLNKGKVLDDLGRHEEALEAFERSGNMLKNSKVYFDLT